MLYRYLGVRGIHLPHGIGVKQYSAGDIIETQVPIEQLGFSIAEFELITIDNEQTAIQEVVGKFDFEIQKLESFIQSKQKEYDTHISDLKSELEKLRKERAAYVADHMPAPEKKSKKKEA